MSIRIVSNMEYSKAQQETKIINKIDAVKGEYYEIVSPTNGDRMTWQCVKAGVLIIGYKRIGIKDVLCFSGSAVMIFKKDITDGFNYGSFM